MKSEQRNVKQV